MTDDWGFTDTAAIVAVEIVLILGAAFLPPVLAAACGIGAVGVPVLFVGRFFMEGAAEAQTDG